MNRIPLYVINNFLKFDRKIYQLFGLKLGRPLRLKSILYFFLFAGMETVLYFMPLIGVLMRLLPFSVLFVIPVLLAYLLSDIGTEGRMPVAYFRSFVTYHIRRFKKISYLRGREIRQPELLQVEGYAKVKQASGKRKKNQRYKITGYATAAGHTTEGRSESK